MSLGDWFGVSKPKKSKLGTSEYSAFKRHSKESFKRAIKKMNYNDRKKALVLDDEIRGKRKSQISQYSYLKKAREKYGDVYKKRLKENVFTKYSKPVGLTKRRREMNIYDIQKQREAEEAGNVNNLHFANQIDARKSQQTAIRTGASPGNVANKLNNQNISRVVINK